MYFPDDMNFQYFFFNTYPGYFLQALPIALLAGGVYTMYRCKRTGSPVTARLTDRIAFCLLRYGASLPDPF